MRPSRYTDLFRFTSALCYADAENDAPVAEAGAVEPAPAAELPAEGAVTEAAPKPEGEEEPPKRKAWWDIRIAQLTDKARAETQAKDQLALENEALKALLIPADSKNAPAPETKPAPAASDFDAAVETRAEAKLAAERFNAQCNAVWDKGNEAFPGKFNEAVAQLNQAGVISNENISFVEAALATEAPEKVLFELGSKPEEAMRIAALPPLQRAVAMDRLARTLSAAQAPISAAPAPMTPLNGARASKAFDPADTSLPYAEWLREREKQVERRRAH